jgi:hypothetical protein
VEGLSVDSVAADGIRRLNSCWSLLGVLLSTDNRDAKFETRILEDKINGRRDCFYLISVALYSFHAPHEIHLFVSWELMKIGGRMTASVV